jgi:hypothetical protein
VTARARIQTTGRFILIAIRGPRRVFPSRPGSRTQESLGVLQLSIVRKQAAPLAQNRMRRSVVSENHVYFREGAENAGVSGGKKAHHPLEIVPGSREASGPLIELAELEMAGTNLPVILRLDIGV